MCMLKCYMYHQCKMFLHASFLKARAGENIFVFVFLLFGQNIYEAMQKSLFLKKSYSEMLQNRYSRMQPRIHGVLLQLLS